MKLTYFWKFQRWRKWLTTSPGCSPCWCWRIARITSNHLVRAPLYELRLRVSRMVTHLHPGCAKGETHRHSNHLLIPGHQWRGAASIDHATLILQVPLAKPFIKGRSEYFHCWYRNSTFTSRVNSHFLMISLDKLETIQYPDRTKLDFKISLTPLCSA